MMMGEHQGYRTVASADDGDRLMKDIRLKPLEPGVVYRINGKSLVLSEGDMGSVKADAIVLGVDANGALKAGVVSLEKSHTPGQAYLMMAAVSEYSGTRRTSKASTIGGCARKALNEANRLGLRSIAFADFSAETGLNISETLPPLINEARKALKGQTGSVKEVRLVFLSSVNHSEAVEAANAIIGTQNRLME
jgi:hypothetical protein